MVLGSGMSTAVLLSLWISSNWVGNLLELKCGIAARKIENIEGHGHTITWNEGRDWDWPNG